MGASKLHQHISAENSGFKTHRNILVELNVDQTADDEDLRYPEDDFSDPSSGAQYFIHRHAAQEMGVTTHIHFFRRWSSVDLQEAGLQTTTTHLVALEIDKNGVPTHWFTVNQWVVGDYWLCAQETIDLFEGWGFSDEGLKKSGRWSFWHRSFARLVQDHLHGAITDLLRRRDTALDALIEKYPERNVLQDRSIEVFDRVPIEHVDCKHAKRQLTICPLA